MGAHDVNDTHRLDGVDAVRARSDSAKKFDPNNSDATAGNDMRAQLQPQPEPPPPSHKGGRDRTSQRDLIVKSVLDACVTFWRNADGEAFATVPCDGRLERYRVRGSAFHKVARAIFGAANISALGTPQGMGDNAWREARATMEAIAFARNDIRAPELRLFREDSGVVWIDLGDETWRLIRVDANGWNLVNGADVPLIRTDGMRALPVPQCGNRDETLKALRTLMNINNDQDFILVMSWLAHVFYPVGPHGVLAIDGEEGAGKSTVVKILRRLVDPNLADHRAAAQNEDDLIIAASNGRIVAFDNVSHLDTEMADAICRMATGAGFSKRRLYTDGDEHIVEVLRPVLLNGIPNLLTRGDLASRSLAITLKSIPDEKRRQEADVWHDFEALAPQAFALLLDALAMALKTLPTMRLKKLPRMADFALFACAAAPAFGWDAQLVFDAIEGNRAEAVTSIIEADRVAVEVRAIAEEGGWHGTATELLAKLSDRVGDQVSRSRQWPKDGTRLSGRLRRVAPSLRRVGVELEFGAARRGMTIFLAERCDKSACTACTACTVQENGSNPRISGEFDGDGLARCVHAERDTAPTPACSENGANPPISEALHAKHATHAAKPTSPRAGTKEIGMASRDRSPSWDDTDTPRAGDRCRMCGGSTWWTKDGNGWCCSTCHPAPTTDVQVITTI